ncbi:DUF1240 domain-containing protein [Xenorhabdus griffiniae]|uniref:DUF1240 domain-containing protein n=1 Tax=Xenorhabdus griffiniae TaxID=351672 RepID=UPI0023598FDB|nr:DUF1240 domain-containing protein [Xenorhabdus griffiniae]MDC9605345.1 DUF1240 domain-containing protein [Xenorhabdus griffiniae]
MNNKYLKALGGLILLIIFTPIMILVISYVFSLFIMEDEITFSSGVIIGVLSSPILFYSISGSIFFFLFDRLPKYNNIIIKYLTRLMIASFIISFPISLYVDYKLKSEGYITCDKISWMSPTTYVKNLSLCK